MRILQLGPYPPPHGGVQANVLAIHERLKQNNQISLIATIVRSSEVKPEPDVYHPRSPFELVWRLLTSLQSDIVHLHIGGDFTLRLATLAFICGILPRRKSILTFHSGGFASSATGKAAKFFSLRGFVVRRINKIIAVNQEIIEVFRRYGVPAKKIELVAPHVLRQPNPAVKVPVQFADFLQNHNPVLLSVGLLETHYDLPLQIRVLEQIKEFYPNAGLLMVGSGTEEDNLRGRIAESEFAEHILLPGDVNHETVLHLIKAADVLLRTTHFDGDAISVREALYLGTPVVASDTGMRPNGVRLFKIGDLDGLQQATVEQLKEGKLATNSSGDGWENIDAVLQIYRDLLQTRQAGNQEPAHLIENLKTKP